MTKRTQSHEEFGSQRFRRKVDDALETVKKILDETRIPTYAADVDHEYDDKFGLAEFLTNASSAATVNALERIGLDGNKLSRLMELSDKGKRSVTLRLAVGETCNFVKEETVEVEGPRTYEHTTETIETKLNDDNDGTAPAKDTKKSVSVRGKVLTKVVEYHWKFAVNYSLYAFVGIDPDDVTSRVPLQDRSSSRGIVTIGNKVSPRHGRVTREPMDASITWLLKNLSSDGDSECKQVICSFSVDRNADTCRTPRRNDDVESAITFFHDFGMWCNRIKTYLVCDLAEHMARYDNAGSSTKQPRPSSDLSLINTKGIFVPVLPLFGENASSGMDIEEATSTEAIMPSSSTALVATSTHYNREGTPLLPDGDVNMFLKEQCRSLDAKIESLRTSFSAGASGHGIFSFSEASISLLALHMRSISEYFVDGVNCVEDMLRKQLVSAIGKQVQPKDFLEYMTFHNKKLFRPEFTPQPFCYTIRRPEHYPDGTLSIIGRMEGEGTGGGEEHTIETVTRKIEGVSRMSFPINAATSVEFTGQRYLHAWVTHDFEKGRNRCFRKVELAARARQFSSFLLLIGKISGPDTFDPKHAIILQNKDELLIPLLLEQLPTPKEFRDAIESLSPEQKRFATAFRNMQLESSVFGVCVVQLKPQLEVLLGLPPDALTKEIRLTQDLLELFIKYHIPSDLLTYSGSEEATLSEKVAVVKGYVDKVREMIAEARAKELEEAGEEADMRFEMADNAQDTAAFCSAPFVGYVGAGRPTAMAAMRRGGGGPHGRMQQLQQQAQSAQILRQSELCQQPQRFGGGGGFDDRRGGGYGGGRYERGGESRFGHRGGDSRFGDRDGRGGGGGPPGGMMQHAQSAQMVKHAAQCQQPRLPPQAQRQQQCRASAPPGPPPKQRSSATAGGMEQSPPSPQTNVPPRASKESLGGGVVGEGAIDFTMIPRQLDSSFDALDDDAALRPTIVKAGPRWEKVSQKSLLTKPRRHYLGDAYQKAEKDRAFDLLDALRRSGALPIECAELHVMVAATHCFDESLMDTVIRGNVNPIEKFERSMLIVASTIHGEATARLLKDEDQVARIADVSPKLMIAASDAPDGTVDDAE